MSEIITRLKRVHKEIRPLIVERLEEFRKNDTEEKVKKEFFFCLLTPQCKARVCWQNVENLSRSGILYRGNAKEVSENFWGVRFRNNKARYIVEARRKFFNGNGNFMEMLSGGGDGKTLRKYLAENVRGMGYKEASHFLRNVGRGEELAILDRHILRGLAMTGVIKKMPEALTARDYLFIEESMKSFSTGIRIPMSHLDFVFWYFFNKEVFK